ncbi:hypothetical protein DMC30DRAFT_333462, partial [Rhodotorula diobovata]
HTFFNDKGFHNHCSHHRALFLATRHSSREVQADPMTLTRLRRMQKPMPPLAPEQITEANWTEHLGDEQYYPNYLAFFHRLISTPPPPSSPYAGRPTSAIPVLERYLFGGDGQMLVRAVSGAIHPLIHIGHGVEFRLVEHIAEGLAQCAVHEAKAAPLFPEEWPPCPPRPSQFQSTLSSAFSSLRLTSPFPTSASYFGSQPIASPSDSFAATAARLPRDKRFPRVGLSGFTILSRILHDEALAPGRACTLDDFPKLDATLRNRASRIVQWCEEWRFSDERAADWEECVEKCEELWWMATVIYSAATRPGYKDIKLDFFLMHGLTSIMFLPSLLEVISPHLRPYLLTSHFRILVAYWVSRGRPDLYVAETLMAATPYPRAPPADAFEDDGSNPWMRVLASAVDHDDEHATKVVRSLYYAATHFGTSEKGIFTSSLPGTELMDGSIFIRAAGLTLASVGWEHEGASGNPGTWDRSALGFPSTWDDS